MQADVSPAQHQFRSEVRAFFASAVDDEVRREAAESGGEHSPTLHRRLAERGWLGLAWPLDYGGLGAGPVEHAIFMEEAHYSGAPMTGAMVTGMVGGALIHIASESLRREFLGGIGSGELLFCLGYTEPEAGSDLAALGTRAVRDGDDYVITGQKIFTTNAHLADFMLLAARTNPDAPKHKGISLFLLPMRQTDISIEPIWTMSGVRVNSVFLTGARVPARLRLGEENDGWRLLGVALEVERSSSSFLGQARRAYDLTVEWLANHDDGALRNDIVAARLARIRAELSVAELLCYSVASSLAEGRIPTFEASASKLYSTELAQRVAVVAMEAAGRAGQLGPDDPSAPASGAAEALHREAVVLTIAGGSNELQRNIIATRGLGLPRS